jgi:predicted nucleic acid-binding protein
MPAVVLDSEALSLLARRRPGRALDEVRALLHTAARRGWQVQVPALVLAELLRGRRTDAAVDQAVRELGLRTVAVGPRLARWAGELLGRARLDSCSMVDATVVATAILAGGGVVATADPDDLALLAADATNVTVQAL